MIASIWNPLSLSLPQRSKRALLAREPKAVEGAKLALFVKGGKCSGTMQAVLKDLAQIKQPNAQALNQKNQVSRKAKGYPIHRRLKQGL